MKYKAMVLFLKYPEKGHVKTRIGNILGDDFAYDLYVNLINTLLNNIKSLNIDLVIVYSIDNINSYKDSLFAKAVTFLRQRGETLGDRIFNAFKSVFDMGYTECTLFGSDIPGIDNDIINESLDSLEKYDIAVGPSEDGGYYMFSLKKECLNRDLFTGINWSTGTVLNETIEKIKSLNLKYNLLSELKDLDTVDDLKEYYDLNSKLDNSLIKFLEQQKGNFYESI